MMFEEGKQQLFLTNARAKFILELSMSQFARHQKQTCWYNDNCLGHAVIHSEGKTKHLSLILLPGAI